MENLDLFFIGARKDVLDVLGCILQYSLYYLLDISKRIQTTWTTPTPALDWMGRLPGAQWTVVHGTRYSTPAALGQLAHPSPDPDP
jgi:hypothetical protein